MVAWNKRRLLSEYERLLSPGPGGTVMILGVYKPIDRDLAPLR